MRRIAALTIIAATPVCSLGHVVEDDHRQSYEVNRRPAMSLLQALDDASPFRGRGGIHHAHTDWSVRWRFRWNTLPSGGCGITSVVTTLSVTMILPELRESSGHGSADFARYLAALLAHEAGHRKVGLDAADEIDRAIAHLGPMADCQVLEREANRIGAAALERAREAEAEYDASTDHGCTQGACLDRRRTADFPSE